MRKLIAAGIAVIALSMPAYAAAAKFYVAQDATSKKCSVVDKKPDGKAMMMIGKKSFATQVLADAAMKADKSCK